MKLLFVYRVCGLGGVETSILNKLEALHVQGIEGYALLSEFFGVGGKALAEHPRITVGLEKEKTKDFLSKGYDAISVIDFPGFIDVIDEAQIQTPLLFESHVSFTPAFDHLYSKLNHPRVSAIVVPSQFNKRQIERVASTTKDIVVIPNPIDRRVFSPRPLHKLQQRFQQLWNGPVIIWVGRIEDEKNPFEFIKIAQRILESRTDVHFMIIGDTFDYPEYKSMLYQAIKEDCRELFTFYQSVPYHEMPEIYSLAAETGGCLVSTSLYESAPMTFIEAMACKCPVVSTDVGGVKEIITNNVTGRLYSVGDVDTGAEAIIELMDTEKGSARSALVNNALAAVAERNSLDSVGQRYRNLVGPLVKSAAERSLSAVWRGAKTKVKQIQNNRLGRWRRSSRKKRHETIGNNDIIPGLVSTIIPVYNRSELLREAVASVLSQTYQKIEVIIVDDGSTDDTAAVCDQLARENLAVKVIHLPHQGRVGLIREAGRVVAKGEYIQYLDSDDLILPTKFTRMVEALNQNPECEIAYSYTRRYRRGDIPSSVPTELTGETFQTMLPAFLSRRFWHTSTPLYRRSICDKVGPWSDLLFWEDIEYDIRIATSNPRLYHCKEFLTDSRDHEMGRVCGIGLYDDPHQMSDASKAARLVYQHVSEFGMTYDDEDLRFFIDDVRMIHKRCRELGLNKEAQRCADIVQDATGADHSNSNGDFKVRATIEPQVEVLGASPGQTVNLSVRVVNESAISFRRGEFAFELSYHLLSVDGSIVQFDNPRSPFTQPLRPGEERVVDLPVRAPDAVGLYYLDIDILWSPSTWLKSMDNPTAIVKLVVGKNIRESKWRFQIYEGNVASVMFPPGYPERVRIAISKAETDTPWHIQLNQDQLSVSAGLTYAVKFQGRADRPRRIAVAVSKAHPPWDGLGLYREIEISSEWQTFQFDFVATADDDNARVHFDVGGSDVSVELSTVTLCNLHAGKSIEPPPLCFLGRLQMDIGVKPLSYEWGTDRGLPVHRYYLEQFLSEFASDIRGRCLEFQDPQYTPRFGGPAVVKLDILHIDDSNPEATLVADLTKPNNLPTDNFDCIICTHVLHSIFEVGKAVSEIYRVLKPGGVLLVAVPNVSMCDPFYNEMWRFTPEGLDVLLARVFGSTNVTLRAYGNSLTAAGEIRGVVVHEFSKAELDNHDPRFAVEVCARAVKPR